MPPYTGPDLCARPARDIVKLLRAKEIAPADLIDAAETRAAQVEPAVNATPTPCFSRARDRAAAAARLPGDDPRVLAGLPVGIKDLNAVEGVKLTMGTWAMRDFVAQETDPLVDRLEARGALVCGKTNTPEFGAGGNTFNAVFGMTRNPYDTSRNAGGSSGGAAVSLAAGEFWLSQGSDLAGSLRTPAAFNNVCGLRPTPGLCGGGPGPAGFLNEGINGPMARDVQDLALFLDAMTGFDPREPLTFDPPNTPYAAAILQDPGPIRIAYAEDQNAFAPVEPAVRAVLRGAMDAAADAGIAVEAACPDLPDLYRTYISLRATHYGTVNDFAPPEVKKFFKKTLKDNIAQGTDQTTQDIYLAHRARSDLYQRMRVFLDAYDVLAVPVVGIAPGPVEEEYPMEVDGQPTADYVDWLRFSFLATTTALPALSLPAGFTDDGMPMGIQLIGPPKGEARLLQVGLALEQVLGLPKGPCDPNVTHP
ncbi:MAG: amidase family protein [Pseudomonadota bacterium]